MDRDCTVVDGGRAFAGRQGLSSFEGISAETAIYVLSGPARMRHGDGLARTLEVESGDYLYIPPGMPHVPANASDSEPCTALIARTDPNEQESVVLLDEEGRRRA
jgi:uncharacterized RmlC-like cupin family protein